MGWTASYFDDLEAILFKNSSFRHDGLLPLAFLFLNEYKRWDSCFLLTFWNIFERVLLLQNCNSLQRREIFWKLGSLHICWLQDFLRSVSEKLRPFAYYLDTVVKLKYQESRVTVHKCIVEQKTAVTSTELLRCLKRWELNIRFLAFFR